jgi:hypothetical protein
MPYFPKHTEVLYPDIETKSTSKRVVECGVSDHRDIGEMDLGMPHPELHRTGMVNKRPGSHSQHRTVEIGTRLYDTAYSRTKPSIRLLRSFELQKCDCAHNTIKSHVALRRMPRMPAPPNLLDFMPNVHEKHQGTFLLTE